MATHTGKRNRLGIYRMDTIAINTKFKERLCTINYRRKCLLVLSQQHMPPSDYKDTCFQLPAKTDALLHLPNSWEGTWTRLQGGLQWGDRSSVIWRKEWVPFVTSQRSIFQTWAFQHSILMEEEKQSVGDFFPIGGCCITCLYIDNWWHQRLLYNVDFSDVSIKFFAPQFLLFCFGSMNKKQSCCIV